MKLFTKLTAGLIVALLFSADVMAQKNFSKDADKAFLNQEYFNAIELYKKAFTKIKKKEEINEPFLTLKDVSISGEITKEGVNDFIKTPFDLLINYYDVNKSSLLLLSIKSKAKFKVGFDTVDKRVNHFIIKSLVENFDEFVLELFKYLKILNKI